jgi:hypothetical protein
MKLEVFAGGRTEKRFWSYGRMRGAVGSWGSIYVV